MRSFKDEKALWNYIRPRLRGRWWRVEAVVPEGMPDVFGMFKSSQVWIELKVSKPSIKALRPSQHDFLVELIRHDQPCWVVFGYRGKVLFYENLQFDTPTLPPFYRANNPQS